MAKTKTFELTNERKLTDQDVLVIRAVHIPKSPRFGSVMLAQLFGVSQPTIDRVVKRETYRHLHRLLLPGLITSDKGSISMPSSQAKFGLWACNKTAYNKARTSVRQGFVGNGFVQQLRGDFEKSYGASVYAPRPVRHVITREGLARRRTKAAQRRLERMKQKYGLAFNERIALAAVGLAPRVSSEEFDALGGIRWKAQQAGVLDDTDDYPLEFFEL